MKMVIAIAAALAGIWTPAANVHKPLDVKTRVWKASWIDVPDSDPQGYGVYLFRREINLDGKPDRFLVHVSGDNRYQLLVNGRRMSWGPARSDLTHWRYETVDLAPALQAGKNVLAAIVWNDGPRRAVAQISNQTAFLLEADQPEDVAVNTNRNWKCIDARAYTPEFLPGAQQTGYYALGPNEHFDATQFPWGWEQAGFDGSQWKSARIISHAADRDSRDAPNRWMLVPREIPLEAQAEEPAFAVRASEGVSVSGSFASVTVPPNQKASILLDQGHMTTAYPEMTVSGGTGASVNLRYAETLYFDKQHKGNRNDVEHKVFFGPADTYVSDGGSHRPYSPLYWRSYRYLRLEIQTQAEPFTIESVRSIFTGYPFQRRAELAASGTQQDEEIQRILNVGWRTARLCAHETYMDCPSYEQLQYAGDARIQMMISIYMTGDTRLMKNGILELNSSRTAEGATYSRAPSALQQYIPPFSLWWIGMVHDYWMYADDPAFVQQMLPGVRAVLSFFAAYQKDNGSLAHMPWWNFVDWAKPWPNGEPPADADGSAAALDLQLLMAYQWAADLERGLGNAALGQQDASAADQLKHTILETDWDASRGLFADEPLHRTYSQQVNTLAVLAHVIRGQQARDVVEKMFADTTLTQSSIYFRAYTNDTLREVGIGDKYLDVLGPWREMLDAGLTTWAEWNGDDARSDCHAWGASPNFEFLRTIAGISSGAPEFKRVVVTPNLGPLAHITAKMPHPAGEIAIDLRNLNGHLSGTVTLPPGIPGVFEWHGHTQPLRPGPNKISF